MKLLDLPPEIFERVIAHYVDDRGIKRAWQRRSVCRTFRDHITTEVLGRQPPSAYLGRRNSSFVRKILVSFLEYRTFALYGAHDVLPAHINKIVNIFTSVTGDTSPKQRSIWIRGMCETLVGTRKDSYACKLAYKPNRNIKSKIASVPGRKEALSVAIIMGERDVVSALAVEQSVFQWAKTATGPDKVCPLELATRKRDPVMMELLLSHAQRSTVKKDVKQQTVTVEKTMECALQGNEPVALVLLDWYFSNFQRPNTSRLADWFEAACISYMTRFLTRLVEKSTPHMQDVFRKRFLYQEDTSSYGYSRRKVRWFDFLIPCFLNIGLFDSSNINSGKTGVGLLCFGTYGLLDMAVCLGRLTVVQRILDAGANVDGILLQAGGMSYPLRKAVQRKRLDVVKLLIEYGADPHSDLVRKA